MRDEKRNSRKSIMYNNKGIQPSNGMVVEDDEEHIWCVFVCVLQMLSLSLSLPFGTKKVSFFWKRTNLIDFLESTRFNVPSRRDKLSFIANEAKCNLSTTFLFFLCSSYFYVYMNIVEKWKKFMAQRRGNSTTTTTATEEWVTDNYFQTHSTTQQRDNFHHFLSLTPARLLNTHSSNGGVGGWLEIKIKVIKLEKLPFSHS